jgi:ADP-heptose:LPS heptosyltransferase
VAVVVEDRFRAVFEGNTDIDAMLPPEVAAVRGWRPVLCLNLHGGPRSLRLTVACGARIRAGFAHFRGAMFYSIRIPTAQEILGVRRAVHTAEHLAAAMFHLGAARREIPRARLFAEPCRAELPYAVIHPFATGTGKTWPADGFLEVAGHLERSFGLEPVFIGSAADDFAPFAGHRAVAGAPLAEIKALMAGASLFAGNDSGPAHVAAAFGVPSLVIFGASDPEIWGPWRTASRTIVARGPIESVRTVEVLEALERLRVAA